MTEQKKPTQPAATSQPATTNTPKQPPRTEADKIAAFRKLANARAKRLIKLYVQIGNLSSRGNYVYTEDQVKALFVAIDDARNAARLRFSGQKVADVKDIL